MRACTSGFVRLIDVSSLVRKAAKHDVVIRVEVRPGDQVVRTNPIGTVWARTGGEVGHADIQAEVDAGIRPGYERTLEQDAAFGFRQLTDIAVTALSPGINDPVTGAHAIGHVSDLLVQLTGRRLGATLHEDDEGVGRVVVPDRDFLCYLDLVCGPIRRYGRNEPTVLIALLRMLRDAAGAARDCRHAVTPPGKGQSPRRDGHLPRT